jgi:hypothetical protein
LRVTERVVTIRMAEGPRQGEELLVPKMVFEDPEFVDKDDDEIVLADWYVDKEHLSPLGVVPADSMFGAQIPL